MIHQEPANGPADGPANGPPSEPGGATYASAGVDVAAADYAIEGMADLVRSTHRAEVIGGLGGFGGLFAIPAGFRQPVLVAGTDGVGTKVAIAAELDRWDTIGIDLVAMCVDDLVCQGAEPLFFLDYQATGRMDPLRVRRIMEGIAVGCRQAGCAILGGELAEHAGTMGADQVDLAGFAVGIVEADQLIDGSRARPGDVLIGLSSPGLRSNGYSLARHVLLSQAGLDLGDEAWVGAATTLGDELLRPSVIYAPAVLAVLRAGVELRAVAHITGGGLVANLPRVLPAHVDAQVDWGSWPVPQIFDEIKRIGGVADDEMLRVFNMGVGMVLAVSPDDAEQVLRIVDAAGQSALVVGGLVEGSGRCVIDVGSPYSVRSGTSSIN